MKNNKLYLYDLQSAFDSHEDIYRQSKSEQTQLQQENSAWRKEAILTETVGSLVSMSE